MGMIGKGAGPIDAATAAYEPSTMSTLGEFLFGGEHGWADAKDHLRQIQYQQALRPVQAQLYQAALQAYGPGGGQSQAQGPTTQPPADLPTAMGNGIGQAIGTVPQYAVPQVGGGQAGGGPRIGDLSDDRVRSRIMLGGMAGLPMAKDELAIGQATVQKNMVMPDGTVIGDLDPSQRGRQFRKAPVDGAIPSAFDAAGNTVDWRLPVGVENYINLTQKPAMLRGQAAIAAAKTGEGSLRLSQTSNPNFAPPPGFSAKPPQRRK